MNEISKAPWANQKVRPFVRLLAWVFLVAALVAAAAAILVTIDKGFPKDKWWDALTTIAAGTYLSAVFARVAITGRAPSGWTPWK